MIKSFNFGICKRIEIVQGDNFYDLHNCYDLYGFSLSMKCGVLGFRPNPVYGKGLQPIILEFHNLDFFQVRLDFSDVEHLMLHEIGFKSPNDFDDEWLLEYDQATCEDHIFFRFFGDFFIRLHGSGAEVREGLMQG